MSSRKHQRTSRSTMATTRAQVESVVTLEENSIQDIWVSQAELLIGKANVFLALILYRV